MKNAIILHGTCDKEEYYSDEYPSASNSHWIPWLQKQLIIKDIETCTPEMFKSYAPDYSLWKSEFEKNVINEKTILVGHSCGGGFLIRWLSENKNVKIGKVILVAPWLDPENTRNNNFFEFKIDSNIVSRTEKFLIFNSTNDDKDIHESLEIIKNNVDNVKIRNFENYGHFCYRNLGTDAFPELLEEILN
ncbi:alpha/beta hydrolase [Candidatus Kuenenbacteria bacterium]|nr:alpha/beta hydrolase [Candidatus Kuenenbacteria bacterium]